MTQARAFFSIIPVGSTHPRLLAIGGRGETSTLQTSEWWEEEEDRWQEGPPLSTGRSSFSAVMAPPHHVCSEIELDTHTCPADGDALTCSLPTMTSGTSINSKDKGHPLLCFTSGDLSPVCESHEGQFFCPTNPNGNLICDISRCPLQGSQLAPVMAEQFTGANSIYFMAVKFLPNFII